MLEKNSFLGKSKLISILVMLLVCVSTSLFSQTTRIEFAENKSLLEVKSNTITSTRVNYVFDGLNVLDVKSDKGTFTELIMPEGYSVGNIGTPKLPAAKNLIEIPFGAEVTVKVLSYTTEEYKLKDLGIMNMLMPVQPSIRKDQDIEKIQFEFEKDVYFKNTFIQPEIATVEILGVLRDMRLARLTVAPISYNPVEGVIRVINNIDLEIVYTGSDVALTNYIKASTYSPYFDVIKKSVINPISNKGAFEDHPDLTKNPIKMLIVSHRDFEATLAPFVEWKTQQGFFVTVAYTDVIGTTANAVKTYIQGVYNAATPEDTAPSFVVIVGDPGKIPASATGSSSGQVTDLYYASIDGDMFPDIYYGRLSARNTGELQNQLDKILYYQKYEFTDPTYLNDVTLIAGSDSYWNPAVGQPTVQYGTQNYFKTANGFTNVNAYLSTYTGCYDNARISVGFINFTAHCSPTSWAGPTLTVSDVHAMTNTGKYPLAVGNCCQSGMFSQAECIGEAWVRAQNKGGVAYIGSAPNTYWFEDFYWSVGAFPISGNNNGYVPTVAETSLGAYDAPFASEYFSVDALKFVGNLAVTQAHLQSYATHSSPLYYWQAYQTFGDPSTVIYLTEGEVNTVSHMPILPIGMEFYTVNALPGSYVGISKNGVLHGASFVGESGEVNVPIMPVLDGGDVMIVVTKPQHIPYIQVIPAAALEGPFIVLDSFVVKDEEGNDNGLIDFSETIKLGVTVKNVGADDGTGITGTIIVDDSYFTLSGSDTADFGNVNAGDENTSTVLNAFTLIVANNVPDQYKASFDLILTDGENDWVSKINLTANAPNLVFQTIVVDDEGEGIPGVLDPGETADIVVAIKNTGAATTLDIQAMAVTISPWVTINTMEVIELTPLAPGGSVEAVFNVTASLDTPLEQAVQFDFTATTGEYSFEDSKTIIVGLIPVYIMGQSATVEACIGKFYDTGGPTGQYGNSQNITMTFYPSQANRVLEFEFISFAVEAHTSCAYDYLKIYNGANTSAPIIGTYCGTNSPGTFMATNATGAITFQFTSDGSVTAAGWEALFRCVNIDEPPTCANNPIPANGSTNITLLQDGKLRWGSVPATFSYDVYIGVNTLPTEVTANVTTNSYDFSIIPNTDYVWKVVPKNSAGEAIGCPTWSFSTGDLPDIVYMQNGSLATCNALFYDSGGPSSSYNNSQNFVYTFLPNQNNYFVKAQFLSFDVEANSTCAWDYLEIYNGQNTSSPLIGKFCGTNSPGIVLADNAQGALTFKFVSDGSVVRPGWSAIITCETNALEVIEVIEFSDMQVFIGTAVENINLPEVAVVKLSDNSFVDVNVIWDGGTPAYDGDVAGTYVFEGTLVETPEVINPSNYRATINVIVFDTEKQIASIETLENITAFYGTTFGSLELPTKVMVTTDDEYSLYLGVIWNEGTPEYSGTALGSYLFEGEIQLIPGFLNDEDVKAYVTVVVVNKNVTSVSGFSPITVSYLTSIEDLNLPENVLVTLVDATTVSLDIDWDNGTPVFNGSVPGAYIFEGELVLIAGVSNTGEYGAYITVNVSFVSATISPNEIDMYLNWPNEDKEIEILWHDATSLSGFKFQNGEEWSEVPSEWYELEDHGDGTATLTIFASEIDMNKADHNVSDDNPWRIEFNMGNHAYGNTNMLV
ncbi:MAG: Ig-like domain-containing protein, partial [Bacteroidetes bacterium]|nr:Ig-like domain-containing protein [Bacteroidota bacterium]